MNYAGIADALEFPRQAGKTHATCEAAKAIDATVICHHHQEAKRLEREYGVKAISIEGVDQLRGTQRPALIDPHAAHALIYRMQTDIDHWKREATLSKQILNSIRRLLP